MGGQVKNENLEGNTAENPTMVNRRLSTRHGGLNTYNLLKKGGDTLTGDLEGKPRAMF